MKKILKLFGPVVRAVLPRMVIIGIDVQDIHIAMSSPKQNHGVANGRAFTALEQIPEETVQEGSIANREQFRDAIKLILSSLVIRRLRSDPIIVLSLPPHRIYTETVIFNVMPESALEEAVDLRLETSLPWPKREAYCDWQRLSIQDPRRVAVFIAAVSRQVIDEYLKIFLEIGWGVMACEFHLISLARLAAAQTTNPFIIILLDEDGAEFAVMHQGGMFAHFFKKIEKEAFTETLSFEVRRLATYAEGELKLKIEEIYIFDKAGLETQLSTLEQKTGLRARALTALPADIDPRFLIASGAARRKFGLKEEVNLLPPGSGGRFNEYLIARTSNLWAKILAAVLIAVSLILGSIWLFINAQVKLLASENAELVLSGNRQIGRSQELFKEATVFNALAEELARARKFETKYGSKLSTLLEEAARQGITVISVRSSAKDGPLSVTFVAPHRQKVLAFKTAIEQSGIFKNLSIPITQLVSETNLRIDAVLQ